MPVKLGKGPGAKPVDMMNSNDNDMRNLVNDIIKNKYSFDISSWLPTFDDAAKNNVCHNVLTAIEENFKQEYLPIGLQTKPIKNLYIDVWLGR